MRLPKKLVFEFPLDLSVAVYGDSISVFHYDNRGPCTYRDCEVWMKEYGVVESWVKQFSVCLVEGIWNVLGFRNNGELLVEMWNKKVVSYQTANKRIKTLEICSGKDSFHLDRAWFDAANGVLKKQLSACDGVDFEDGRAPSKEKAAIEAELEHFSVRDVHLIMDRNSRRSKGVGYIEFYDAMSVPMAIALSGYLLFGQPGMVKPSEAEKNLVQTNASGGGSVVGSYGAVDRKLYVGNLHFNMTEFQLKQIFEAFGPVELVQLPTDPETGNCKGFGFIQMVFGVENGIFLIYVRRTLFFL